MEEEERAREEKGEGERCEIHKGKKKNSDDCKLLNSPVIDLINVY